MAVSKCFLCQRMIFSPNYLMLNISPGGIGLRAIPAVCLIRTRLMARLLIVCKRIKTRMSGRRSMMSTIAILKTFMVLRLCGNQLKRIDVSSQFFRNSGLLSSGLFFACVDLGGWLLLAIGLKFQLGVRLSRRQRGDLDMIFTVEGSGQFPFDMLRYDASWPRTGARVHHSTQFAFGRAFFLRVLI